ncbi:MULTISPECIES: Ku protein [Citricoccus]|uniref:non-homologous end joining protein Ku n=1 Tax=Citricoccus TaxID=169133 RepID=UPI00058BF599|nr:Ku protein [Citricoccus sp. CH26A]
MRAIWSGSITFGLVNVPVKAYSTTTDHDVSFHQVHDADGGRIRYQRRCEVCGKKIDYEHIDKAYDDGDQTVVIHEEEFEALPEATNDEIEVVQFVPSDQVDPVTLEKSYFLEPQGKSPKSYLLLREALQSTDRTAIVTFALRQKTRLGVLRVQDDVLVLQGMHWADEIREVDFPATRSRAKISPKEKKLAKALVDQFASDFTPEEFEDTYQVELRKLIDAKLEQGDSLDTEATFGASGSDEDAGEDAEVIDLMEALKASLDRKRGRGRTTRSGRSTGSGRSGSAKGSSTSRASGASKKSAASGRKGASGTTSSKGSTKNSSGGSAKGSSGGSAKSAKTTAKSSGRSPRKKTGTSSSRRKSA